MSSSLTVPGFLAICAFTLAALFSSQPALAQNPTNKAECLQMVRGPLEQQCQAQFAGAGQSSQLAACLELAGPQVEQVCEQFFGDSSDFCSTCTSSCTSTYTAGNAKRKECLSMCLEHPGCG